MASAGSGGGSTLGYLVYAIVLPLPLYDDFYDAHAVVMAEFKCVGDISDQDSSTSEEIGMGKYTTTASCSHNSVDF